MIGMAEQLIPEVSELLSKGTELLKRAVEDLRTDSGYNELETYLYDWAVVLCVLADDVLRAVQTLLEAGNRRPTYMLSRALAEYDVRLRYYVVQSWKPRRAHREKPEIPIAHLKDKMHVVRDWDNAGAKLVRALNLYDPNVWTGEMRERIEKAVASAENDQGAPYVEMLNFLKSNEVEIRGVIRMLRPWVNHRYFNARATWRMQSGFLHGDQMIVSDVLGFDKNGKSDQVAIESPGSSAMMAFMALDSVIELLRSVGMIRTHVIGADALHDRATAVWTRIRDSI